MHHIRCPRMGLALAFWVLLGASYGHAADIKRVALVIGNGQYDSGGRLANPTNDANSVAAALRRLKFDEVRVALDVNYVSLRTTLTDFAPLAQGADMAMVFYAGHGMEVEGQNYLIPTDARFSRAKDVELNAISLRQVQSAIEDAKVIGLVILDACRDNPFANNMSDPGKTRGFARGLSRPVTRGNTLIVYSARDGTTAADGIGPNSPFTTALLKSIEIPDLEIGLLFRQIRDDVIAATGPDPQEPFTYGSLSAKPIFLRQSGSGAKPTETSTEPKANRPLALEPTLDEYRSLFSSATLRPEWDNRLDVTRAALLSGRNRYEAVARATGVPWFVIGILNVMEAGGSFNSHLHNGDPLTGRTVQVPAGRPPTGNPPFTWEDSATDAIRVKKLDQVRAWTLEDTLSIFERYNGLGMRRRGVPTPYLWSGSTVYEKGRYVGPGVFDPNAVSQQIGAAVLLKYAVPRQELERALKYKEN